MIIITKWIVIRLGSNRNRFLVVYKLIGWTVIITGPEEDFISWLSSGDGGACRQPGNERFWGNISLLIHILHERNFTQWDKLRILEMLHSRVIAQAQESMEQHAMRRFYEACGEKQRP